MYPIPGPHEKNIIDLDESCMKYKKGFSDRLQKVWKDCEKVSKPYLFDEGLIHSASLSNIPESRNQGFRIGVPIV